VIRSRKRRKKKRKRGPRGSGTKLLSNKKGKQRGNEDKNNGIKEKEKDRLENPYQNTKHKKNPAGSQVRGRAGNRNGRAVDDKRERQEG